MRSKLLVVGTIAYDTIKTPYAKVERILGGSATHIALASSMFNLDCSIISIVGNDFEKKHLDLLREKGIVRSAKESGFSVVRRKLNQAPFYFSQLIEFKRIKGNN